MPTKRLIILANSIKKGGRCVAGREIVEKKGIVSYGDWIRPISRTGEGELRVWNIRYADGAIPKVFDVVDVPLQEQEQCDSQPENWFIDDTRRWILVDGYEDELPQVETESPHGLWIDPEGRDDRISPEALGKLARGQSLHLIDVSQFRIGIEWNGFSERHQRKARFRYRGRDYVLGLTDPEMDKYCLPFPAAGMNKSVELDTGGEKMLCVSLAPEFNGFHYKIVATVLEPNE